MCGPGGERGDHVEFAAERAVPLATPVKPLAVASQPCETPDPYTPIRWAPGGDSSSCQFWFDGHARVNGRPI
jgi:hypothetical protein